MPRRPSTPDTYFQVPLCIFGWGRTTRQRLNMVIDFGCLHAGRVSLRTKTSKELASRLSGDIHSARRPRGFNPRNRCHIETLVGANQIGITYQDFTNREETTAEFEEFWRVFEHNHGTDCSVRLRMDLVLEARDGGGMTYPELAILAAILSVLGKRRKPVRITLATIRCRAMGYRSQSIASMEQGKRMDGARPFSEWEVRRTVQSLQLRRFINRATYGRRVTYYGIGQDVEAFRKSIVARHTHRPAALGIHRQLDDAMTDEIRRLKALCQGGDDPQESHAAG